MRTDPYGVEDTREPEDELTMWCAQCGRLSHLCWCPDGPDLIDYQCPDCGEFYEDCRCKEEEE